VAGHIPAQLIDEIRDRVDIAELISEYVPLSRSGKNLKGLCPFHSEKTPSFMVNPELQIFHCFGCGMGGNAFHFLMKHENCSFPEAVRILAQRVSVTIPQRATASDPGQRLQERLLALNEEACQFFQTCLQSPQAERARRYLDERRISNEALNRFRLGYAPSGWDTLLRAFTQKGYDPRFLEQAGLVKLREQGTGYYDRFRDRVIFPLHNLEGRVIGFGGRILAGDSEAKYLNSPETPVYSKGENLYGLYQAKPWFRRESRAILVEGYFDLITMVQAGIEGVAAGLGTALTRSQCRLLARFVRTVVLLFDGDLAGETAAQRGYELLLEAGLGVKVAVLPAGTDPDSFLQSERAEGLKILLDRAKPFLEYLIDHETRGALRLSASERWHCLERLLPYLTRVANDGERDEYVRCLADTLRFRPEVLTAHLEKSRKKEGGLPGSRRETERASIDVQNRWEARDRSHLPQKEELAERWLVQVMLCDPKIIGRLRGHLTPDDFRDRDLGAIAESLLNAGESGTEKGIAGLLESLQTEEQRHLASKLTLQRFECDDTEALITDCLRTLRERKVEEELFRIQRRIQEAQQGDRQEELRVLSERKSQVLKEQRNLVP